MVKTPYNMISLPQYAIVDETLRDGLQAPYVLQPTVEQALILFEHIRKLGVQKADIGFAAAGPTAFKRSLEIAKQNFKTGTPIIISCAARTIKSDIDPIIEISQKIGHTLEADTFIGLDQFRIKAEGWTTEYMVKNVEEATKHAVKNGISTVLVTETSFIGIKQIPEIVKEIYLAGLHAGASRVCLCDTTGAHTPDEIVEGVIWIRSLLDSHGFKEVGIDVHAHDDLTCAVANSVAALMAGADRVHGTILGIGERRGNADLIPLLVQLHRKGMQSKHDITVLPKYAMDASAFLGIPISNTHPVIGSDVGCMVSGVHAAAVYKGRKNKVEDSKGIYLPFDFEKVGIVPSHTTKIGQQAGAGNVRLFCLINELPEPTEDQIQRVLFAAKRLDQRGFLTREQIATLLLQSS